MAACGPPPSWSSSCLEEGNWRAGVDGWEARRGGWEGKWEKEGTLVEMLRRNGLVFSWGTLRVNDGLCEELAVSNVAILPLSASVSLILCGHMVCND